MNELIDNKKKEMNEIQTLVKDGVFPLLVISLLGKLEFIEKQTAELEEVDLFIVVTI